MDIHVSTEIANIHSCKVISDFFKNFQIPWNNTWSIIMKFKNWFCSDSKLMHCCICKNKIEEMNTLISTFHFWLHNSTARLSNVLNVKGDSVVCPEWRQNWGTNRLTNTILQGLMMVSIHGPDDSEFDFRTRGFKVFYNRRYFLNFRRYLKN